jgi:predicted transcriptional regulator
MKDRLGLPQIATPASPGAPAEFEGRSAYGPSHVHWDDADLIIMTQFEFQRYRDPLRRPALIVDRDYDKHWGGRQVTGQEMMDWLRRHRLQTQVAVQTGEAQIDGGESFEYKEVETVLSDWRKRADYRGMNEVQPPLNLLSLNGKGSTEPHAFPQMYRYIKELSEGQPMVKYSGDKTTCCTVSYSNDKERRLQSFAVDLVSSTRFHIFGQRGAISAWHCDNAGVFTHARLQESGTSTPAIKFWPVYPGHRHPRQEQMIKAFATNTYGAPPLPENVKIPCIAMRAGYTLVMPPLTFHAPLTITDSLMLGGMGWSKKAMGQTLEGWGAVLKYPDLTNEDVPLQMRFIVTRLKADINADQAGCGCAKIKWRPILQDILVGAAEGMGITQGVGEDGKVMDVETMAVCYCVAGCGPLCTCQALGIPCDAKRCHKRNPGETAKD